MPELVEMGIEIEKENNIDRKNKKFPLKIKIQNILIQNLGMIIGLGCMLVIALYSKKIIL